MMRTIASGRAVVHLPVGETFGNCCSSHWLDSIEAVYKQCQNIQRQIKTLTCTSAVNKKNKFACRLNCSNKNFGKKVARLYFAVLQLRIVRTSNTIYWSVFHNCIFELNTIKPFPLIKNDDYENCAKQQYTTNLIRLLQNTCEFWI